MHAAHQPGCPTRLLSRSADARRAFGSLARSLSLSPWLRLGAVRADYAAFMDLKNEKKRAFYGVEADWVEPFGLIEIIETPDLGVSSHPPPSRRLECRERAESAPRSRRDRAEIATSPVFREGTWPGAHAWAFPT